MSNIEEPVSSLKIDDNEALAGKGLDVTSEIVADGSMSTFPIDDSDPSTIKNQDAPTKEAMKQDNNQMETDPPKDNALEGSEPEKPEDKENKEDEEDDENYDESDNSNYSDFTITADDESDEGKDSTHLLAKGTILKEEGNAHFKSDDLVKAYRSYRKGVSLIKPLNAQNTGDDQVKALLVTLQTNLSMVCFKQDKPKMSIEVASRALAIDGSNVKALFRRAAAYRKLGDIDKARADLRAALKYDPTNTAVKRELLSIKKAIEDATRDQKKALQKAFSSKSGGSFLYDDKVEEERKKVEEKLRKQEEEREALKKRKADWKDECVKRMANDQPAISFEEWDKQRKRREKSLAKLKKQEEERVKEEKKKAKEIARIEDKQADSDEELNDNDLSLLRGYKKTADGRTTSYFTREASDTDKHLIGDITPQRLGENPVEEVTRQFASVSPSASADVLSQSGKGRPSAWNHAGTWEEKDTSEWCRERLKYRLKETKAETGPAVAVVTSVDDMTGEASVAITLGKKRYIFDLHTTVEYEIRESEDDEVMATGSLRLPDICSTSHDELEVEVRKWTKAPSNDVKDIASKCQESLVSAIRESVKAWVTDFNEEF
jgi:tetratricopeptide (TPR) repeat protein